MTPRPLVPYPDPVQFYLSSSKNYSNSKNFYLRWTYVRKIIKNLKTISTKIKGQKKHENTFSVKNLYEWDDKRHYSGGEPETVGCDCLEVQTERDRGGVGVSLRLRGTIRMGHTLMEKWNEL